MEPGSIEIAAIKSRSSRRLLDNEDILFEFASLLQHGRIDRLISLFTDCAIVTEPFSASNVLYGKAEIRDFLQIAASMIKNLHCQIHIAQNRQQWNREISAFFIFSRGNSDRMYITIKFGSQDPASPDYDKIRSLDILAVG